MDTLGAERNLGVFKEPRGFLKILQILMAIFAFATTCGYSSSSSFNVKCNKSKTQLHVVKFYYPFRLHADSPVHIPLCDDKTVKAGTVSIFGNYQSSSQFYVFVGVICMLFCAAAMVLYTFFNEAYRSNDRIPKYDFFATMAFIVMWFLSSCIWAGDVSKVKEYTAPERIILEVKPCTVNSTSICSANESANFANLNVSLIFGFANVGLWAGSLWFAWKETSWFSARNAGNLESDMGQQVVDPAQQPPVGDVMDYQ